MRVLKNESSFEGAGGWDLLRCAKDSLSTESDLDGGRCRHVPSAPRQSVHPATLASRDHTQSVQITNNTSK